MNFNQEVDQPLDNEAEKLIDMVGERRYLMGIIKDMGVKINMPVDELTDYECRQFLRAIIRNAKDYPRTIQ